MGRRPAGAVYALVVAAVLERAHHVHADARRSTRGFSGCHHPSGSLPASFCPCYRRVHRSGRGEVISLENLALQPREVTPVESPGRENADRKSILMLNRRKLPKQILSCRADARWALGILWEAYPHLAFLIEEDRLEASYEQLGGILGGESSFVRVDEMPATTLLLDGKSIAATMEVLRKAQNVSAALQLLRLSVEAAIWNRRMQKLQTLTRGDSNELRTVYKSVISLLGHTNRAEESSSNASHLIMHILRHHMPTVAGIWPGAEMYHGALNALGRLGKCDLILELLIKMEGTANDLTSAVPPVDRMAYQTAISSLARHGNCQVATKLLSRMQLGEFQPDTNIYNELLVGIAKEAGRCGEASGRDYTSVALQILQAMESKTHATSLQFRRLGMRERRALE